MSTMTARPKTGPSRDRPACRIDRAVHHLPPKFRLGMLLVMFANVLAAQCNPAGADETTPDFFEGGGIMGRVDHIEGTGIPQIFPITPVQLFPYYIYDESMFFGDVRVFPTNYFTVGGNAGVGYRYYSESLNRVFGVSGWYDADNTRRVFLQQLGLSLETYAGPFDLRSNFYLPVGQITRQNGVALVPGTTQFQGDNLVYDQLRSYIVGMRGLDAEIGRLLPGEFCDEHGIRAYGGGYYFNDSQGDHITGASARIQANLVAGLDTQLQVTYDNFFKSRIFFGLSYTFGALHRSEMKQTTAYGRMGEHVTRNYTVVAEGHNKTEHMTAVDPATSSPYTFAHVVSSAAPGGDGSINNPFNTIAAAQLAGRNIVFVHAGSTFNTGITFNPGERIFGDGGGIQHFLQVPQLGALLLPQAAGPLPVLSGTVGDAVVLANNTEFSGFTINNAGGNAVVGTSLQNVLLSSIAINSPTADGILLTNTAGPVSIWNAGVSNPGGSGIELQGGTGAVQFLGTTTVSGAGGPGVLINNLASAGTVSFADLGIDHRNGIGFQVLNSAGTVNVTGALNISNANNVNVAALDIENSAGTSTFNTVNVSNAIGPTGGVNLQNNAGGTTSFSTLNIGSTTTLIPTTALVAVNAGNLNVNPAVNNVANLSLGGVISVADGAAVNIQGTNLNANFNSISSNNAPVAAISLLNTTGLFSVFGNGSGNAGTGGTITNAGTAILLQNAGTTGFGYMNLASNGVGIKAVNVSNLAFSNSSLTNSTGLGMDLTNVHSLLVKNSTFSGNGAANIQAQFSQLGSYTYTLTNNTFTSAIADNLDLAVIAGGQGSTMNLLLQGDAFTNSHSSTAGLNLAWNGTLSAGIDSSTFVASGGMNTGALISNASTTGLTNVSFTNSSFTSTGGADTAFNLTTAGASQVTIFDNLAQFNAANGTAFQMSLAPSAIVSVSSNTVNDTVGGATGLLFSSVTGPGTFTINDNRMNMTTLGADRGIIFSSVTNTIQLIGTQNNGILNATTPFFVPVGTTTGHIIVNGLFVP